MKSDIEISQDATLKPIVEIANKMGLSEDEIDLYGKYKAKIRPEVFQKLPDKKGKLVLVTAINPTPAGEGKSTVSIGLSDALNLLNYKTILTLREPSLGPVMGLKGGATGGGYSQVVPMEDINLHFTGDIHAITAANNALSAFIDNHLERGNKLGIDVRRVQWKRAVDMNDRALRHIVVGLGGTMQGVPREDGFDITVASEIMAILCLANSFEDLKTRLSKIIIAYNYDHQPITVKDLGVEGALALLLKDAFQPNIVQTLGGTPTLIHGGPFANIAHGCNSIRALEVATHYADYTVTEAGFGADLGAEKFMDIVTPVLGQTPDAVVIVATCRALKYNGGVEKDELIYPNVDALKKGMANLEKHIETMKNYNVPVVVAINTFESDTEEELQLLQQMGQSYNVPVERVEVWQQGGEGGLALANSVIKACENSQEFCKLYDSNDPLTKKADTIVQKVYGGKQAIFESSALKDLKHLELLHLDHLPLCMAKTQYSLSDDPTKLGRPENFDIHIKHLIPKTGAGFIVALTGDVMTMPGLPAKPAALNMDIDENGKAKGLF